jgi:hypothetical protein
MRWVLRFRYAVPCSAPARCADRSLDDQGRQAGRVGEYGADQRLGAMTAAITWLADRIGQDRPGLSIHNWGRYTGLGPPGDNEPRRTGMAAATG